MKEPKKLPLNDRVFGRIRNARTNAAGWIELPLLILNEPLLPHTIITTPLAGTANVAALENLPKPTNTMLVTFQRQPGTTGTGLLEHIHSISTEAAVIALPRRHPDGRLMIDAEGRRRVEIIAITQTEPYLKARARILPDVVANQERIITLRETLFDLFQQIIDLDEAFPDELAEEIFMIEDPSELCDAVALALPLEMAERQQVLELVDVEKRLDYLATLLVREMNRLEIAGEVNDRVNEEISRVQRELYLREQMRVIQSELGEAEEDVFHQEVRELRERIAAAQLPDEAREKALKETNRLASMAPMSPESGVIRTYVDWLLGIPWAQRSADNLDMHNAERVLNKAHYGLDKVKDRVLEYIAVRKLAADKMKSPVLCFLGPPGVGKTSLGKSIAEALGRKFVRVSLGGVHDEAEIRGHRRTYIGALPGRIIQTMKRAGTRNPVFMLDEIDKMSEDYRGDPAAALLEVLDPEQNFEFFDHYLEVPYDLSDVLFIATANDLYPLPEALEDRLEVIEFRTYTDEEKLEIAQRFLIPKQLEAHGLAQRGIHFQKDALQTLIHQYTLEAGVRNLEREIGSVCRKITRQVATDKPHPRRITPELVEKLLGPPYIFKTRINREDSIGVATGVVWSAGGGDIQIIEASLLPGKGSLTLTGQLGDVLQESATTALSYMRSRAKDFGVPYDDFENYDVHIHMPEGSVPKEGPSAGITLALAIISVFTERRIRSEYVMTGEVTLRGHVLPVGGIKEKVLAARRYGLRHVILPQENKKDLVDVPANALKDLDLHFVTHMQQVIDLLLLEAPAARQRDLDAEAEDAAAEAAEAAAKAKKTRSRKKKPDAATPDDAAIL